MKSESRLLSTGIDGLDNILNGGFPAKRVYLIQGDPGVGKTTMALKLLLHGAANGESVLYVTLSETRDEIEGVAASHGWSLAALHIHEMANSDDGPADRTENTLFVPAEVGAKQVFTLAAAEGVQVRHLRPSVPTLEDVFARAVGER